MEIIKQNKKIDEIFSTLVYKSVYTFFKKSLISMISPEPEA